jgi:hypothetical protein
MPGIIGYNTDFDVPDNSNDSFDDFGTFDDF